MRFRRERPGHMGTILGPWEEGGQGGTGTPAVCTDGTRPFETGRRGYAFMFIWLRSGVSPARACQDRAVEKDRLGDMITVLARAPDG